MKWHPVLLISKYKTATFTIEILNFPDYSPPGLRKAKEIERQRERAVWGTSSEEEDFKTRCEKLNKNATDVKLDQRKEVELIDNGKIVWAKLYCI
jgi:hypothetical protein